MRECFEQTGFDWCWQLVELFIFIKMICYFVENLTVSDHVDCLTVEFIEYLHDFVDWLDISRVINCLLDFFDYSQRVCVAVACPKN